jgi:hypothetical protein
MNSARPKLLVVARPIIERRQGKVIKNKVAVEGIGVEPKLVPEAYSGHVRTGRRRHRRVSSSVHVRVSHRHARLGKWRSSHKIRAEIEITDTSAKF